MKKIFLLISIIASSLSFSQGDDCFNATSLGSTPNPPACGTGVQTAGSSINYNGTTIGSVAENPYSSLSCMDAPAADVWVTFTASANEMDLDFTSGLNDANIGIYTGDCTNGLLGLFCETSNNGNINTHLALFTPGDTYYMQISGIDESDFANFNLQLTAVNNCDLCVLESNITASPAPTNGFYLPGTTVQFCIEITEYEQVSANWIHGVLPSFGSSWDMSTLTPISSPSASGNYDWIWTDPSGSDPIGWYVDD